MLEINKRITLVNRTIASNRSIDWIVIHYVGAVSSAKNNVDFFYNNDLGKSAHYFVDNTEIWQCVEDKDIAWHCGAEVYYNDCRNDNSIGIEMCCKRNAAGELYIDAPTILNTIELTNYLIKKYNIEQENVVRHYDVTRKVCPVPFVEEESLWIDFKRRLANLDFTDVNSALDYLVDKGRITNRDYWEKAIDCVRNQEFVFIKWANDLRAFLEE
ncbi:MAG: N-acetylmuramoyl-L-alanine amidase [Clostridia bacterium]|nr:N-acetylmuramoyl-L-alanine amidase [Clostridia bacterium]